MKERCLNPSNKRWKDYGGRGITFQDSWEKFECFLSDMGLPPSDKHTLERIDVNGAYTKENCTWATHKEQNRNRRNNKLLTYKGQTKCLAEWAEDFGLSQHTLWARLEILKWELSRALNEPVRRKSKLLDFSAEMQKSTAIHTYFQDQT